MDCKTWKNYRRLSFANFCLSYFTYGLSTTIHSATEFFYFRDDMDTGNPQLYFGMVTAVYAFSGLIFSFVGSLYFDMTHRIRGLFLCVCAANVLAHILHSLYFFPAVVVTSYIFIGMGAAREVSAMAELARLYEPDELTAKVSVMASFGLIGTLIGPCTAFVFNLVDTHIGNWRLHINTMPDVVMASLYIVNFTLNLFTLKNLSKERVVKTDSLQMATLIKKEEIVEENEKGISNDEETSTNSRFFRQYIAGVQTLVKDWRFLLILAMAFLARFVLIWSIMLGPIKYSFYLSWTQIQVALADIVTLIIGGIFSSIAVQRLSKSIADIDFVLYSMVATVCGLIFFVLFPYVPDKTVMAAFVYVSLTILSSGYSTDDIATRSMLAKMVPVSLQGVAEGFRNAIQQTAVLVAGLSLTFATNYMTAALTSIAVLCIVCFVIFFAKREHYYQPKIIIPASQ